MFFYLFQKQTNWNRKIKILSNEFVSSFFLWVLCLVYRVVLLSSFDLSNQQFLFFWLLLVVLSPNRITVGLYGFNALAYVCLFGNKPLHIFRAISEITSICSFESVDSFALLFDTNVLRVMHMSSSDESFCKFVINSYCTSVF